MRNVIILGGSSSSGIVNRLAAELVANNIQDVNLILAEGQEQAMAIAETLAAEEDSTDKVSSERVLVLGLGCNSIGRGFADMAAAFAQQFTVAEIPTLDFVIPRQNHSPYWQQGNQKFDRKQQGMKAKARRR